MLIAGAKPPGITALERAYALWGVLQEWEYSNIFCWGRVPAALALNGAEAAAGGVRFGHGLSLDGMSGFFAVEIGEQGREDRLLA